MIVQDMFECVIVFGEYVLGEKFNEVEIVIWLNVLCGLVCEVFCVFEQVGLLCNEKNCGVIVCVVLLCEVEEIYEVCVMFDELVVCVFVKCILFEMLKVLKGIIQLMKDVVKMYDVMCYIELNVQFYDVMVVGVGNIYFIDIYWWFVCQFGLLCQVVIEVEEDVIVVLVVEYDKIVQVFVVGDEDKVVVFVCEYVVYGFVWMCCMYEQGLFVMGKVVWEKVGV